MAKTDPLDKAYVIEWPRDTKIALPAGRWQIEGDHIVAHMFRSELIDAMTLAGELTIDQRNELMALGAKYTKAVVTPNAIFSVPVAQGLQESLLETKEIHTPAREQLALAL